MKKIGVGFVGAGWMGSVQMKRITERDDAQLLGLCEPNKERAHEVLKGLGLSTDLWTDDYDQLVKNPDIDAMWLVSPNSFHGQQAVKAMKAGKHVFCEKPCATTFADYMAEIELEKANPKLFTFVDYLLNFDHMELQLRDMVRKGEFGQITQVQVNYRHPINIAGDKVWKLRKDIMGDAIGMGIIHSLSVMILLMKEQGAKPVKVYATNMEAKVRGFEAPPVWNIVVRFDTGATGFCFGNIDNCLGYDAYHNIFGTDGAFVFDSQTDRSHKVRYWSAKSTDKKWVYPLDPERCKAEGAAALAWPADTSTPDSGDVINHQTDLCVGHFIECIKSGQKSPLSFVNSTIFAEIGWAAQMSAALHKEIDLPLDWAGAKAFFGA